LVFDYIKDKESSFTDAISLYVDIDIDDVFVSLVSFRKKSQTIFCLSKSLATPTSSPQTFMRFTFPIQLHYARIGGSRWKAIE